MNPGILKVSHRIGIVQSVIQLGHIYGALVHYLDLIVDFVVAVFLRDDSKQIDWLFDRFFKPLIHRLCDLLI